jgi:hypothetical protein
MLQSLLEQYATQYGIPLDIARALVGAESAWKPDAVSPKGAVGLTQLMPATAKGLGVDPYDPEQNLRGGMQYLGQQYKEFGSWPLALAAYNAGPGRVRQYGGIPPFPETQAYINKIMGGQRAPVQLAQAGRPDIEQGLYSEIPRMGAQQPQQQAPGMAMPPQQGPRMAMPPPQPPGFMDKLGAAMQSPLFMTGASILANNTGNYGAAAPAIGRGLMGGQAMAGAMQEDALNAQMKRMQMQAAQQKMAQEAAYAANVEAYIGTLDKEDQMRARMAPDEWAKAEITKRMGTGQEQIGVKPEYELDPVTGKWHKLRYGSRGTVLQEEMTRTPGIYEYRDPEMIQRQAEARAAGAETGKQTATAKLNFGTIVDKAGRATALIDSMLSHPGFISAVGGSSYIPSIRGGDAYNYERKLDELKGKMFLEAYESLRGTGNITEIEGKKATDAMNDLDIGQSEEAHKKSLETIKEIIISGMKRAADKAGIQPAGTGNWTFEKVQ